MTHQNGSRRICPPRGVLRRPSLCLHGTGGHQPVSPSHYRASSYPRVVSLPAPPGVAFASALSSLKPELLSRFGGSGHGICRSPAESGAGAYIGVLSDGVRVVINVPTRHSHPHISGGR